MQFASLGSGSKGNATLVKTSDACVMVDCGFALKVLQQRMATLALSPSDLSAVLITHEHGDHIRGLAALLRKYPVPVYLTAGTASALPSEFKPLLHPIEAGHCFTLGQTRICAVGVPHDAKEPVQFVFHHQGLKLGILSDLGSITETVIQAYSGCDGLMVEANYCPKRLASGPYPISLKKRVAGRWGHLSNEQTAHLLSQLDNSRLQHLVIGHISQQNNTPELTTLALQHLTPQLPFQIASQEHGFHWLHIHPGHSRGHTHAA